MDSDGWHSISGSGRKWPVMPRKRTIFWSRACEQGFHGAALGEDLLDLVVGPNVVQLPQVEVIGVQQLERLLQHAQRAIFGALLVLLARNASERRFFITSPT